MQRLGVVTQVPSGVFFVEMGDLKIIQYVVGKIWKKL